MTKEIKVFETFSGGGAQHKAITNIFNNNELLLKYGIDPENVKYKIVGTSEISKSVIIGYDAIHYGPQLSYPNYETIKTKTMLNFISKFPLINDNGESLQFEKIKKWKHKDIRQLYIALKRTKNYGSITDIKGKNLPKIDIFTYSFPCQDISSISVGAGLERGTRSGLLWEIERILRELAERGRLPKTLVCENVPDLISDKYINDWNMFLACLVEFGYLNTSMILDARDFGIPQARKRFFCISELNGKLNYNIDKQDSYPSIHKFLNTENNDFLEEKKSAIPNNTKSSIKYVNGSSKLNDMSYCNTITTKQNRFPNAGLFHSGLDGKLIDNPEKDWNINGTKSSFRFITPREQMQLMGFESEDYDKLKEANLLDSSIEKLAGNSIVVPKLEAIFISIIHRMIGKKRVVRAKVEATPTEIATDINISKVDDKDVLKIDGDLSSIFNDEVVEERSVEPIVPSPEKETLVSHKYNGWKNYETWNVMLWINGTEKLCKALKYSINQHRTKNKKLSYKKFINEIGYQNEKTGDGIDFISHKLDYRELNYSIQG